MDYFINIRYFAHKFSTKKVNGTTESETSNEELFLRGTIDNLNSFIPYSSLTLNSFLII